jgi:raffinose/stachyose/melibiose transport system substrate-binding protein
MLSVALAFLTFLVGSFSPSLAAEAKTKLKIYTQYTDATEILPFDYARNALRQLMPEVELVLETEQQDDDQKLMLYASTGNLPDIYRATASVLAAFKRNGDALLLDPYIAETRADRRLTPYARSAYLYDSQGHAYGFPNQGSLLACIYANKRVFRENNIALPSNYQEFLAAVRQFKAKGIVPLALFAKEKWPGVQLFDMLATRDEARGLAGIDAGEGRFSDPAYRQAAEKLAELSKAGLVSSELFTTDWEGAANLFYTGKAAMILNGAWAMGDFFKNVGDDCVALWYPLADARSSAESRWNMSGGGVSQVFCVNPQSKNRDLAARYAILFALKFAEGRVKLLADPSQILVDNPQPDSGYNPLQIQYIKDSANFRTMTCFLWGISNPELRNTLGDRVQGLLAGGYPAADFVRDLDRVVAK